MASPCEIHVETTDLAHANDLIHLGSSEAWRIEQKFSRYRDDNIIFRINHAHGEPVIVDPETASLLDFSAECYAISDGLFDVTSGILREAWHFDGSDRLPDVTKIKFLLSRIGWQKLSWEKPCLILPAQMELDFGGIGKEYAVDRVLSLLTAQTSCPVLVNFGGDLHASGPREGQQAWITGIENPADEQIPINMLELYQGALATSGDAFRYLEKDGVRYGHILNPMTGWPADNAPHSVTVAAQNCTQAGILATLAMLHGEEAEVFLESQQVRSWVYR